MSTPALVDLVCHLYEDTYGKVGAKILKLLLNKGRCTLPEIVKQTGLPVSATQRTLVSLVTNRFVLFWNGPRTYYFANWKQVYFILWTGEILNDKPDDVRDLLMRAISEGLLPASDLESKTETDSVKSYFRLVSDWEFWPTEELKQSLEQQSKTMLSSDPSVMGKSEAAKKQLIAASTQNELAKIHNQVGSPKSDQQYYVVDWDQFLIRARRQELVAYASRVVGSVSAKLYEIVLKLSEKSVQSVRQIRVPALDTSVTTQSIVGLLNEELIAEMKSVFSGHEVAKDEESASGTSGDTSSAKRSKLNSGSAKTAVLASMSPAELVNKHLQLLASVKSARFVQRIGGRQQGEWFVPFDRIVEDLQRSTLDEIIAQSLGEPAARLIRLIRASGKLDEKMLANQALLPALEIRHQMSALANFGFADIQELAKPNERGSTAGAQKRSLFLWYHRPKWAHSRLLDMLYVQLNKILDGLGSLRKEHTILLAKLTREDVISDMDQFLTPKEKEELDEFREAEHALYKRMNMIDRTVRIFREY